MRSDQRVGDRRLNVGEPAEGRQEQNYGALSLRGEYLRKRIEHFFTSLPKRRAAVAHLRARDARNETRRQKVDCRPCQSDEQRMSWDTVLRVVAAMGALKSHPLVKQKPPELPGGFCGIGSTYRFAVLSRQVLFAAAQPVVVGATV